MAPIHKHLCELATTSGSFQMAVMSQTQWS